MGNTILNDDAVGIILVRYLKKHLDNITTDIEFKETSWGGFRIIDLIRGYNYVVVLDAIKTGNFFPGHIHKLKTSDLLPTLRLNSYHDINFITAIKLAETFKEKMPEDIDIIAVEVENNFTIAEKLSDEIIQSIEKCTKIVLDLLKAKNISLDTDSINIHKLKSFEDLEEYYNFEIQDVVNI